MSSSPGGTAELVEWIGTYFDAMNARDGGESVVGFLSDDYLYVDFAFGVQARGKPAIREYMRSLETSASSDYRFQAERIFTDGESFAIEWTFSGTNDRADERAGMPATGRRFDVPGVTIGRLRDGKVTETRTYWNMAAYLAQLGLAGPPRVPVTTTS